MNPDVVAYPGTLQGTTATNSQELCGKLLPIVVLSGFTRLLIPAVASSYRGGSPGTQETERPRLPTFFPNMNTDQAQLVRVLSRHDHSPFVKLKNGSTWERISIAQARDLVRRRKYTWTGTGGRVKQLFPADGQPIQVVKWQHCYRTAEAPVIQPSIEWLNSRRAA